MSEIGKNIKTVRQLMGLNQKEFGQQIGVTGSGVSSIELTNKVSNQTLKRISDISGFKIKDIIDGTFADNSSKVQLSPNEYTTSMLIAELKEQLRTKDNQIAFLEKQLDRVLGKSEMYPGDAAARLAA